MSDEPAIPPPPGAPIPPPPGAPIPPPPGATAPSASARETIIAEVERALAEKTGYSVSRGTDTDLVIGSEIANASWGVGRKKVDYSAIMKVEEAERTVYWWEMLKESSAGLSFGSMGLETHTISGAQRWGTKKEVILGPDGVEVDYKWDYAATRRLAEEIASRHGFKLKVVLMKKSAQR